MQAAELFANAQLQADHRRRLDKRRHNEDGRSKQTQEKHLGGVQYSCERKPQHEFVENASRKHLLRRVIA